MLSAKSRVMVMHFSVFLNHFDRNPIMAVQVSLGLMHHTVLMSAQRWQV